MAERRRRAQATAGNDDQLKQRFERDSVKETLELIGERWTMLVLRECFFGVRRYSQFARNLSVPRPTLSDRLAKLVDTNLLYREPYGGGTLRQDFEYRLTEAGHGLFAAIIVLMQWGDTYLDHPDGPPIVLRHRNCGQITHPRLTCDTCGETVDDHNITPEPGPNFTHP